MKRRTVISLEQALSLPSATLRFAQLGWRVIRIEPAPTGAGLPGDPNRYIGGRIADADRHSYFVAPNVGKEAIAIDLKSDQGKSILHRLIEKLEADVFCCNTLPSRYEMLGIDYETLSAIRPELIWAGISALGPDFPNVPGYDPILQALAGYMEVTGQADGPPLLSGIPIIDLKAGDEVFAGVMLALAERAETGKGRRIDISMLQAAASWLITLIPLIDFGCAPDELTRTGNEHRKFVPTNAYPTSDGFIYVAMGSDGQWRRFVSNPRFASLDRPEYSTNAGRTAHRKELALEIAAISAIASSGELAEELSAATIPNAQINSIPDVLNMAAIRDVVTKTMTPDGKTVRMQPPASSHCAPHTELAFAPRYGEHTQAILMETGLSGSEIDALAHAGVIAGPSAVPA